ncbi:MAG: family 10 glycosylhydrolase [Candidatus Obscuribacterales bacterium]|nr:family 10 glycosylhydrolase [Candidatus Obscuribacterales bacterium]
MKFKGLGILVTAISLYFSLCSQAQAASIAVLKSAKNADSYQNQNIGSYDEDWQSFRRTLESANLRYDVLNDKDLSQNKLAQYKVLILPLLIDINDENTKAIKDYLKAGGRILATDSGGTPTNNAAEINLQAGAKVTGHDAMQEAKQLVWSSNGETYKQDFAVGTLTAKIAVDGSGLAAANWNSAGEAAASRKNGNIFLGWALGLQGETSTNVKVITLALEEISPGLSKSATAQMTNKDYLVYQKDLDSLQKRTEDAINMASQSDLSVPLKIIQNHYEAALTHAKEFKDYYQNNKYFEADSALSVARNEFSLAYAQSMPVRAVEARSVWLDRGTIVSCQTEQGLAALFDRLSKTGINVVYFETNNAGYVMYPSKISQQNPQTLKWNPLATAVKEARKRGMEIHAWLWTFNVGNTFHNPIINQEPDYPGPVLSNTDLTWALSSANGSFIPPKQHEFWLDPSNKDARKLIKSLISEVVANYDLDGIQLDYIRYPFNGKGGEMGFDWLGRQQFERATGLCLDKIDEKTRKAWQDWKTKQVSSFVQDISETVRKMKPGLRISAAVYAMPRSQRLTAIQQDWETWVEKGWVDTLNPMTYVAKGSELNNMAGYVRQSSKNQALVYPGLFIKDLDTAGFIEQLDISRSIGSLGNTMFAVAQLDDTKSSLLRLGPYRRAPLMTPQADPLGAVRLIFDNFAQAVSRYAQDPERPIVSDRANTNEVLNQIESIQKLLHSLPAENKVEDLIAVDSQLSSLENNLTDWLAIDSFVKRAPRALYISSYLKQARAILSYAAHRSKIKAAAAPSKPKS